MLNSMEGHFVRLYATLGRVFRRADELESSDLAASEGVRDKWFGEAWPHARQTRAAAHRVFPAARLRRCAFLHRSRPIGADIAHSQQQRSGAGETTHTEFDCLRNSQTAGCASLPVHRSAVVRPKFFLSHHALRTRHTIRLTTPFRFSTFAR